LIGLDNHFADQHFAAHRLDAEHRSGLLGRRRGQCAARACKAGSDFERAPRSLSGLVGVWLRMAAMRLKEAFR
jgi:hypothetical protein